MVDVFRRVEILAARGVRDQRIDQGESTCTLDASDPRFNLLAGQAAACVQAPLVVEVFKRCGSRPSYLII